MTKIFISYSRLDRELVDDLSHELSQRGLDVWSDRNIKAGEDWWEEIKQAAEKVDYYILVLTPNSIASQSTNFEMGVALSRQDEAYVIPVLMKDVRIPHHLSSLQYLDGRNVDTSKLGEKISEIIKNKESE